MLAAIAGMLLETTPRVLLVWVLASVVGSMNRNANLARSRLSKQGPKWGLFFGRSSLGIEAFALKIAFTPDRAPKSAESWGLGPPSFMCARDYPFVFFLGKHCL